MMPSGTMNIKRSRRSRICEEIPASLSMEELETWFQYAARRPQEEGKRKEVSRANAMKRLSRLSKMSISYMHESSQ
jgi:hypothetical protein